MSLPDPLKIGDSLSHHDATTGGSDLRPHLSHALVLLLQAYDYAIDLEQDVWDLAVELHVLREAGLSNSDLRWMVGKGYAEHAIETTGPEDRVRRFRRTPLLTFVDPTCVVLTRAGLVVARESCAHEQSISQAGKAVVGLCNSTDLEKRPPRPTWDHQRRQLRVGVEIVKEFKLPSPNQETVLAALEEEAWPPRIDDPLPPVPNIDSRRRLHDTIRALNRKQKSDLIRFMGDGSGEGIRWEPNARRAVGLARTALSEDA